MFMMGGSIRRKLKYQKLKGKRGVRGEQWEFRMGKGGAAVAEARAYDG